MSKFRSTRGAPSPKVNAPRSSQRSSQQSAPPPIPPKKPNSGSTPPDAIDDFAQYLFSSDGFLILALLTSVALLIIAMILSWEDYSTSLKAYELLPTYQANDWVTPFVAALPQLVTILAFFLAANDAALRNVTTAPRVLKTVIAAGGASWAKYIAYFAILVDVSTDTFFRSGWASTGIFNPTLIFIALLESVVLFTFGSELLFIWSATALRDLLPKAREAYWRSKGYIP